MLTQLLSQNPAIEVFEGLEQWCALFNEFFLILVIYLKYIFVFLLITIGISTLMKYRGMYRIQRVKGFEAEDEKQDSLRNARLIVGWGYIFFGLGILFNFLTYFLIIVLDPLPDRFIFAFINFSDSIDPLIMNRIEDIEYAIYPHEKTIYYGVALGSLTALTNIIIVIYLFINNNKVSNPQDITRVLISFLTLGMMCGFTTCLPFFL